MHLSLKFVFPLDVVTSAPTPHVRIWPTNGRAQPVEPQQCHHTVHPLIQSHPFLMCFERAESSLTVTLIRITSTLARHPTVRCFSMCMHNMMQHIVIKL